MGMAFCDYDMHSKTNQSTAKAIKLVEPEAAWTQDFPWPCQVSKHTLRVESPWGNGRNDFSI